MIYRADDYIIYKVGYDLFYAKITEPQRSPYMVRVITLFSLTDIEHSTVEPTKSQNLSISYIKKIISRDLSKKEIIAKYPEYMI